MHGLINCAIERFVSVTYGPPCWRAVTERAGLGVFHFEAMLGYDDPLTDAVLKAAECELSRPSDVLLEDLGTFLVSHSSNAVLRRLLRFGGGDYVEFLHSFEDLPERARLAVPDLELPVIALNQSTAGEYDLRLSSPYAGFAPVFVGLLRAMADDYGTLVLLHHQGRKGQADSIAITVVDTEFADGKAFFLAAGASAFQKAAE